MCTQRIRMEHVNIIQQLTEKLMMILQLYNEVTMTDVTNSVYRYVVETKYPDS